VGEVPNVVWASKTELTWSAAPGATSHRVLRGILGDLAKLLTVLDDSCERFSGSATTTGPVLTEDPAGATGGLYWYLVVGSNGTYEGPAGQATAGDRIANAPGACP
jgi:hypothetical protein